MVTTIRVPEELMRGLRRLKRHPRHSYADVVEDVQDRLDENHSTRGASAKRAIRESWRDFEQGQVEALDEVRKDLRL